MALNLGFVGKKLSDYAGGVGQFFGGAANTAAQDATGAAQAVYHNVIQPTADIAANVGQNYLPVFSPAFQLAKKITTPTGTDPIAAAEGVAKIGYQNSPVGLAQQAAGDTAASITGKPQVSFLERHTPVQDAAPVLGNKALGVGLAASSIPLNLAGAAGEFKIPTPEPVIKPKVALADQSGYIGQPRVGGKFGEGLQTSPAVNVNDPQSVFNRMVGIKQELQGNSATGSHGLEDQYQVEKQLADNPSLSKHDQMKRNDALENSPMVAHMRDLYQQQEELQSHFDRHFPAQGKPTLMARLKAPLQSEGGYLGGTEPRPNIPKTTSSEGFNPQQYVDELTKRQEAAAEVPKSFGKTVAKLKSLGVDALAPIEDPVNKATSGFYSPESLKLRNALDRSLRGSTIAGQFVKDNGLDEIIQNVPDTKAFDQYLVAKHAADLEKNGVKTGRNLGKDQQLVEALKGQYEPHAQALTKYNHILLDKATEYGLISKENASYLKQKYPNYVPMERIFNDEELQGAKGSGSSAASLSKQEIVRRIEGSKREVSSPLQSILKKTHDLIHQGERSDAARAVAETRHIEGNPLDVKPLRTAENVKARMDLYGKAAELKPIQNKLQRLLVTRNRWGRSLQSELDKLNAKGLHLSLKQKTEAPAKFSVEGLGGATPTSKAGAFKPIDFVATEKGLRGNDARKIEQLGRVRDEQHHLAEAAFQGNREPGLVSADHPGVIAERKSRAAQAQIDKILKKRGTAQDQLVNESKLGATDTKALVNSLVQKPSSEITKIKNKIATRENRLGPILDQIASMSDDLANVKRQRSDAFSEARLRADAVSRNKETISTYKDGIKEIYEVSPQVAAAAKSLSKEQLGLLGKIFSYPTRVLRLGATSLNPAFTAANVAKDTMSAVINSSHGLKNSVANPDVFLSALKAAFNHGSNEYGELVREGAGGTSFDIGRNEQKQSVNLIRSRKNVGTRALYTVTHPGELLRAAEDTIGRSEEFGRAAQYFGAKKTAEAAGRTDAKAYAADAARNNTVNFSRGGDYGRVLNSTLPYLNAGIQGSRTLVRNLKEHPTSTVAKIATFAFMPVAAATAWNLSDPERKKAYDNIMETEKQNNIIIVPPNPKQDASGRWNVIKIPMSQELANAANVVRNGIESLHGDKSFDFAGMAGNLFGTATSLNTQNPRQLVDQLTPQAVKPGLEGLVNENLFTGQQIVPDAQKNLPGPQQVNKNTSGTARVAGNLTGLSPEKIDNALRTAGGGLEQNLIHTSDQALAAIGVIKPDQVKGKGFVDAMANRFNSAQGQTPGSQFYSSIQQSSKDNHLSGSDYNGLQTILSKGFDGDGNAIPSNEKTAQERNTILADSPKVAAVMASSAKSLAQAQGKPLDPLYGLSPEQQNTYYKLQSTPYQGPEYDRISSTNASWLKPFETARSQFFAANPLSGLTPSDRVKYPKFDQPTQNLMDQAQQITAVPSDQRSTAQIATLRNIYSQPKVVAAFAAIDKYTNDRRVAQGFDPLKTSPQPTSEVQALLDAKNYKDPRASAYLAKVAEYNVAKGGAADLFSGVTPSQSELSGIYNLGNYDISKQAMANGTNQYALAGSPGYAAGATASQSHSSHRTSSGVKFARNTIKRAGTRHGGGGLGKVKLASGHSKGMKIAKVAKPKVSLKSSAV